MRPSPKKEGQNQKQKSESESSDEDSLSSQTAELDQSSKVYHHMRGNLSQNPKDQLKYILIIMLIKFIVYTFILFFAVFALKYMVVSTKNFGQLPNCSISKIYFNGWDFTCHCGQCHQGFVLQAHNNYCQPL